MLSVCFMRPRRALLRRLALLLSINGLPAFAERKNILIIEIYSLIYCARVGAGAEAPRRGSHLTHLRDLFFIVDIGSCKCEQRENKRPIMIESFHFFL